MSEALEITRKAKSNLAFALKFMPPERREAMIVFYAYCRTIDDLADDPGVEVEQRLASLDAWRQGLLRGFDEPSGFQAEVIAMRDEYKIPTELMLAIIEGCSMDTRPQRFETWEELTGYTSKVAGAVGLVSVRLFGCTSEAADRYAIALGHALQLTNIIRDVGEDLDNGNRIYLPLADLARFGYTESDLIAKIHDERFIALMRFQAERAEHYYAETESHITAAEFDQLRPTRAMAAIYRALLEKIVADNFRVLDRRYRLSSAKKIAILTKTLIATKPSDQ